jgi:hypothetical protein
MIRRIQEYLDNKEELEETEREYEKMRKLLLFSLRSTDKLIKDIEEVIDSNEYGNKYDKKAKIKELLSDFKQKKL